MKGFDSEAEHNIQDMMAQRDYLTQEGDEQVRQGNSLLALMAYEEAQDLSYDAGEGLKVGITSESADRNAWHELEHKIQLLKQVVYGS